ncbi:MAG: hypothetical protein ACE5EF_12180 [Dehalococcoidia bacterium]
MTSAQVLRGLAVFLTGALFLLSADRAAAQFGPPSTFLGTVADAEETITGGMLVEAYIGDTLCSLPSGGPSDSATFPYGEGEGRVMFYVVDVVGEAQVAGCGRDGVEVRIKIDGRFANETGHWRQGPVRMNLTFGEIEPAVQPTTTPTPPGAAETQTATSAGTGTAVPAATGTSGAAAAATGTGDVPAGNTAAVSAAQTRPGGLGTSVGSATYDDGGGFPVWGILLIALGALSLAGGAIGVIAAQRGGEDEA